MKRYQHLSGLNHRFIKLEGRDYWMLLNDDSWAETTHAPLDFLFADEQFYTFSQGETTAQQQAERLLFREVAAAVARQQLESEAINEIARDLKAAFAEQDMERLIESFSHYLKQDDWYR